MRKIAATYIFPVTAPPIKYGILYLDDNNRVAGIKDNGGVMIEEAGCEYYSGVLIPGLVNAHTHLELSHLKGIVEKGLGMRVFLEKMMTKPHVDVTEIERFADIFDRFMFEQGIVAAGDISNTPDTAMIKAKSKLKYHTFVELLGLTEVEAIDRLEKGAKIVKHFTAQGLSATLTPHAPYSVSNLLLDEINLLAENDLYSIHLMENSIEEETLTDSPKSFKKLFSEFGITGFSDFKAHPYERMLWALRKKQVLSVHNVFSTKQDWEIALKYRVQNQLSLFAVTCPRSNMYINGRLPQYKEWPSETPICIGTDSLASNDDLSVFNEILFLLEKTEIPFSELLTWATVNGARALRFDNEFGSFDVGKTPGVNLISQFDYKKMKPADGATISRLI